jgi:hypothetical protein
MRADDVEAVVQVISDAAGSAANWPTIWQASGIFMALFDDTPAQALGRLADRALLAKLPLIAIARAVVDSMASP